MSWLSPVSWAKWTWTAVRGGEGEEDEEGQEDSEEREQRGEREEEEEEERSQGCRQVLRLSPETTDRVTHIFVYLCVCPSGSGISAWRCDGLERGKWGGEESLVSFFVVCTPRCRAQHTCGVTDCFSEPHWHMCSKERAHSHRSQWGHHCLDTNMTHSEGIGTSRTCFSCLLLKTLLSIVPSTFTPTSTLGHLIRYCTSILSQSIKSSKCQSLYLLWLTALSRANWTMQCYKTTVPVFVLIYTACTLVSYLMVLTK